MISSLLSILVGFNILSINNTAYKISSEREQGRLLTFESKVTQKKLQVVIKTPITKFLKLNLNTLDSGSDEIKMPSNGEFNLVFESNSIYSITDNDATDGEAKIQLPPQVMDFYINTDYQENEVSSRLNLEDKLYYLKDSLIKGTYHLGKRLFPIPDTWHSEDKSRYVLRFKNNGLSKADFKFFESDKVDYPSGIAEIGDEGGIIELTGVGKLEIPQGAIPQRTVISIKEQLQGRGPIEPILSTHSDRRLPYLDYVSPLIKIEPMNLKLKKDAILTFSEINLKRLGNNHPSFIHFRISKDQDIWYSLPIKTNIPIRQWTAYLPTKIGEFGYFAKFIYKNILPTSNEQLNENTILENNKKFISKGYIIDFSKS